MPVLLCVGGRLSLRLCSGSRSPPAPWSEALLLCGWGWGWGWGAYKVGVDGDIGFFSEKCRNLVLSRNGRIRVNSFSRHSLSTYSVPG